MGMNCQPGPEAAALGAWRPRSRAEAQLSSVSTCDATAGGCGVTVQKNFLPGEEPGGNRLERAPFCLSCCLSWVVWGNRTDDSSELEAGERQRWSPLQA